ncbi:MAG: alpha/beta hydrolase [Flavobacteriales bacterium]|nr:alpha/beta hydrolase [Flavobacteriales bacterium]MBL0037262.1 alpha/beta hydrolase [Flavobacteriales bacterium]
MCTIKTRDDVNLYVKDHGTGRPVVLLHGWPLSADTFDDLALAITKAGMRAISYDRRGFGRSEQPYAGYEYDTLGDDLADVMNELDLNDATLIGFSMGGGEVARYLSRHGSSRVSQAVLISSVVPYMLKTDTNPHGVEQKVFDGMAESILKDRPHFWAGFFKDFYGVGLLEKPVSEEVLHWSNHMAMQGGLKATLDCAAAFATTDFRPDLKSFTVPTLILHGTADKTVPIDPTGREAHKGIPGSKLVEYQGAAHGLLATDKEQIASDVLAFITEGVTRDLVDIQSQVA